MTPQIWESLGLDFILSENHWSTAEGQESVILNRMSETTVAIKKKNLRLLSDFIAEKRTFKKESF